MKKKSTLIKNEIKLNDKKPIKVEKVKKEKKFLISARKLFITFSPCNLPINEILKEFKIRLEKFGITQYLITREESEIVGNLNYHVHIYLELANKCQFRSSKFLDLGELHGNYQSVKSKFDTVKYILKNVTNKNDPEVILFSQEIELFISENCEWLCDEAFFIEQARKGKIPETMKHLEQNNPKKYFSEGRFIENRMREIRLDELGFIVKFNIKDFIVPKEFEDQMFSKEILEGKITPFIIGPSGCGKSQYIQAFIAELPNLKQKRPLIINNIDGLRFFKEDKNNCIILDDINWSLVKDRENLIKLLDSEDESTFDVKHGSVSIPSNTPRFIVSNFSLEEYLKNRTDIEICAAIKRRFVEIILPDNIKLYTPKV